MKSLRFLYLTILEKALLPTLAFPFCQFCGCDNYSLRCNNFPFVNLPPFYLQAKLFCETA